VSISQVQEGTERKTNKYFQKSFANYIFNILFLLIFSLKKIMLYCGPRAQIKLARGRNITSNKRKFLFPFSKIFFVKKNACCIFGIPVGLGFRR